MIKAVIFDLFGVIISDAYILAYEKMGGNYAEDKVWLDDIINASNHGWITPEESRLKVAEHLRITPEEWLLAVASGETRDDMLLTWIEELRKQYKTGLLSNVSTGGLHRRFSDEELKRYFDATVASSDVGFAKPSPEIYHFTANKLGMQEDECVFFDDRQEYVAGAVAVGMKALVYTSFKQAKSDFDRVVASQPV